MRGRREISRHGAESLIRVAKHNARAGNGSPASIARRLKGGQPQVYAELAMSDKIKMKDCCGVCVWKVIRASATPLIVRAVRSVTGAHRRYAKANGEIS